MGMITIYESERLRPVEMKCSNKPECSVIWSQETDCLGNLQQEKCSFQHYFDHLNIKGFICLVTADMFTSSGCPTLPKACVVLLCSRNLAYFSSSRPPLAKDCSKGWGAYFNDLTSFAVQWQSPLDSQSLRELSLAPALMPHTCKCVLDWWMLFLQTCESVYLVIWSRAALEILYANTLQERYSISPSSQPIMSTLGCLTQETSESHWHWKHWPHFPQFSQGGAPPALSGATQLGRWSPSPCAKLIS